LTNIKPVHYLLILKLLFDVNFGQQCQVAIGADIPDYNLEEAAVQVGGKQFGII
jgi:hypothetical protein